MNSMSSTRPMEPDDIVKILLSPAFKILRKYKYYYNHKVELIVTTSHAIWLCSL